MRDMTFGRRPRRPKPVANPVFRCPGCGLEVPGSRGFTEHKGACGPFKIWLSNLNREGILNERVKKALEAADAVFQRVGRPPKNDILDAAVGRRIKKLLDDQLDGLFLDLTLADALELRTQIREREEAEKARLEAQRPPPSPVPDPSTRKGGKRRNGAPQN